MRLIALVCLVCLPIGCGTTPTPTAPTPSVATLPTSAAVSSSRARVPVGAAEKMSAAVTLPSGTISTNPSGIWTTDAPLVATVNAEGLVTTIRPGDVTVSFDDTSGVRGSKHLTVIGDFSGTWTGSYTIAGCAQSGDFATNGFCTTFASGLSGPFGLTTTQSGDAVTATWTLGSTGVLTQGPLTYAAAPIAASGPFGANVTLSAERADDAVPTISTWQLTQTGVAQFNGTLEIRLRPASMAGAGVFSSRVPGLTRTTSFPVGFTFFGSTPARTFGEIRVALQLR